MKSNFKLKIRGPVFSLSGARGKPWLGGAGFAARKKNEKHLLKNLNR